MLSSSVDRSRMFAGRKDKASATYKAVVVNFVLCVVVQNGSHEVVENDCRYVVVRLSRGYQENIESISRLVQT
jgi:hypothetical protein